MGRHEGALVFLGAAENRERQVEQQDARVGTHSDSGNVVVVVVLLLLLLLTGVTALRFFTDGPLTETRESRGRPSSAGARATRDRQRAERHDIYRGTRERLVHVLRPLFIASVCQPMRRR